MIKCGYKAHNDKTEIANKFIVENPDKEVVDHFKGLLLLSDLRVEAREVTAGDFMQTHGYSRIKFTVCVPCAGSTITKLNDFKQQGKITGYTTESTQNFRVE